MPCRARPKDVLIPPKAMALGHTSERFSIPGSIEECLAHDTRHWSYSGRASELTRGFEFSVWVSWISVSGGLKEIEKLTNSTKCWEQNVKQDNFLKKFERSPLEELGKFPWIRTTERDFQGHPSTLASSAYCTDASSFQTSDRASSCPWSQGRSHSPRMLWMCGCLIVDVACMEAHFTEEEIRAKGRVPGCGSLRPVLPIQCSSPSCCSEIRRTWSPFVGPAGEAW